MSVAASSILVTTTQARSLAEILVLHMRRPATGKPGVASCRDLRAQLETAVVT